MAPDATDRTINGPASFGVGTVVAGTYEVTALLGQGGMGAVFAARHLRLPGKRVALKVLHQGGKDGEAYARFRREAEIVSRIGHPNIVEVLDFNTLPDGTPYLVLEYLSGESLAARVARGPLAVDAALDLLRQMGSALQAAHRAGVVHRDMKPDNVFLCPSDAGGVIHDRVKVLDFGISKIRGSQTVVTQESVLIGTPQYMAPEQALGQNQAIDARVDQFALACILYEMLSGKPPFSGDSLAAVIYAIVHGPHVPLTGVPRGVSAAIDRALSKKPDDRFGDIGAFIEGVTGRPLETLRGADGASPVAPVARTAIATDPLAATAPPVSSSPSSSSSSSSYSSATVPPAALSVAPPTTTAARRSPAAAIMVALVVAAAIGAAVVWLRPHPPAVEPAPPAAVAPPPPVVAPPPAALPQPPPAAQPTPEPAARPTAEEKRTPPPAAFASKRASARPEPEAVPAAAAAELAQAEEALAAGNVAEAIRLAQHSLYAGKSSRAFAIVTMARCRQGDLGGARAALGQVTSAQRKSVLRDCAAHGMDLR